MAPKKAAPKSKRSAGGFVGAKVYGLRNKQHGATAKSAIAPGWSEKHRDFFVKSPPSKRALKRRAAPKNLFVIEMEEGEWMSVEMLRDRMMRDWNAPASTEITDTGILDAVKRAIEGGAVGTVIGWRMGYIFVGGRA